MYSMDSTDSTASDGLRDTRYLPASWTDPATGLPADRHPDVRLVAYVGTDRGTAEIAAYWLDEDIEACALATHAASLKAPSAEILDADNRCIWIYPVERDDTDDYWRMSTSGHPITLDALSARDPYGWCLQCPFCEATYPAIAEEYHTDGELVCDECESRPRLRLTELGRIWEQLDRVKAGAR